MARVLGTIIVKGQRKPLTTYDYEWALKSTLAEAGGSPANTWEWGAVLWTMTHRWAGNYGRPGESLGEYIQRFSQPVNVTQIGRVYNYDRTADDPTGVAHSQARDARIRANRARAVSDIERQHPELAAYVLKFMRGGVSRTPYALFADFAAAYAGHSASDTLVGQAKGNAFYAEPWIHTLDVTFTKTATTAVIAAGLTLVALGAGVGYYFWRKGQTVAGLGNAHTACFHTVRPI